MPSNRKIFVWSKRRSNTNISHLRMIDLASDPALSFFSLYFRFVDTFPIRKHSVSRQQLKYANLKYGFNDYLKFLPVFVLETFALFKLIISYIDLCSQMSSGFFCRNFLKITPKFLSLSISHMRDINEFLNSLCHRRCWLSRTVYKSKYLQ